jgi:hypothetical protein
MATVQRLFQPGMLPVPSRSSTVENPASRSQDSSSAGMSATEFEKLLAGIQVKVLPDEPDLSFAALIG